jgi:cystine transport system substrate-binding protein
LRLLAALLLAVAGWTSLAAEPLRVGLEGTYPPFGYIDEQGRLVGFDVEVAASIADHLGRPVRYVQAKWDGMLAGLDADRFDIVVNAVTPTAERRRKYAFSAPYCFSGLQLIGRSGTSAEVGDLAGKRIGVGLGTIHEKWLREHRPAAEIRSYEDDASRNQDLLVGRIDLVLNDRLVVAQMLQRYRGRLVAVGAPLERQEKAVALRLDRPDLNRQIDAALAAMRADGSLRRISEKWFDADVSQ